MGLITNVSEMQLLQSPDLTPLDFVWRIEGRSVQKKVGYTRRIAELLSRILEAATSIKKGEDQLRRKKSDFSTRVAKCIEADGGIFRTFFAEL